MRRNLKTVPDLAAGGPFTEGQLRWLIFQADTNGLAECGAVVRVGRRVYLDEDVLFGEWLDKQNARTARTSATA